MAEINDFNVTDASNTARWPENMAPSAVNNAGRADEGILARWHKDTNGSKATTGSTNAYVFAADQTLSAYYDGLVIAADANFTNTGAATLNVDAVGADSIVLQNGQPLVGGEIVSGQKFWVVHDGTNWQLLNPAANGTVQIYSSDAGATTGPVIVLDRDSASPLAGDNLGEIVFRGESSTGADVDYAGVRGELVDPTNANPDGEVIIETNVAGTKGAALHVGQGVYTPTATGGDKGADTLNVSEIYDDDTQVHAVAAGLETPIATTSGTAHDFTGIRSDARRITVMFAGVSLSGTDNLLVQIGDSGGFETSGYLSTSAAISSGGNAVSSATNGFIIRNAGAANTVSGHMVLTLIDSVNNTWVSSHAGKIGTLEVRTGGGDKSLSDVLTQVRITRTGSNTFDAGSVNILVE